MDLNAWALSSSNALARAPSFRIVAIGGEFVGHECEPWLVVVCVLLAVGMGKQNDEPETCTLLGTKAVFEGAQCRLEMGYTVSLHRGYAYASFRGACPGPPALCVRSHQVGVFYALLYSMS